MIDEHRFKAAVEQACKGKGTRSGIGTLGEKTIHAVLKNYFCPNIIYHERRLDSYYADIFNGTDIIEIQSKQFYRLKKKLENFLERYPVTLVYPVAGYKKIFWLDKETGECSGGRASPKKGTVYQIFPELYQIKEYIKNTNLRICVVLLDVQEYRWLNGWSKDRKKGSSCYDRIPVRLLEEVFLDSADSYRRLLPDSLSEGFTSKELAQKVHITRKLAQSTLHILRELGVVQVIGKQGNSLVYKK